MRCFSAIAAAKRARCTATLGELAEGGWPISTPQAT